MHLFECQLKRAEKHKNVPTFMLHLNLSTDISSLTCGFWICEAAAIDFSIPAGYQEPSLHILHTIWHLCCSDDGTWTIYLQWFPDRDKTPEYYSEMFFPLLPLWELHVIYPLLENLGSGVQRHHVPFQDFKLLLRTAGGDSKSGHVGWLL